MAKKSSRKTKKENHTRLTTTASNIRLEEASSSRQSKRYKTTSLVSSITPDIRPVGNFLDFLKEHAVVGLIIGFVIGNQVQSLIKQLIQSFVDPLTKLLFGTELSERTFTLHLHKRYANFSWGAMVYALIIFIFVIVAMYLAIKMLKLENVEKKSE